MKEKSKEKLTKGKELESKSRLKKMRFTANRFRKKWQFAAAAAVLAAAAAGVFTLRPDKRQTAEAGAVVKADYPKTAPYPNEEDYYKANGEYDHDRFSKDYDVWWETVRARRELTGYEAGLDTFLRESTRQFLSDAAKENRVYSPLNVYMALGMLAELTDGSSRGQILDLLGSTDIEALRKQASDLWNANYCDDGAVTSILAGSLWLGQDIRFVQNTMKSLAEHYHASSYQGKMGSDALNRLFQGWLNEQTGGLLKEQAASQKLDAGTILALAATVYFRAKWSYDFSEKMTETDIFHGESGDMDCDFMHKEQCSETYYWGEKFSAAAQSLNESGSMWFLLPDEGVSVDELLRDDEAMEFLLSKDRYEWKNQKQMLINLAVPKFDVSSKFDLREGLQAMGITDIFDPEVSDFSPAAADMDGLYLSRADHAARVAVDEKGVTAAAYTVMAVSGSAMPMGEETDFVLDRPFVFGITGSDGLPLFVGAVRNL